MLASSYVPYILTKYNTRSTQLSLVQVLPTNLECVAAIDDDSRFCKRITGAVLSPVFLMTFNSTTFPSAL